MDKTKKLSVTLMRSTIGSLEAQKATVEALGLKKVGQSREHNDNPAIRGMLHRVRHLVAVEEV